MVRTRATSLDGRPPVPSARATKGRGCGRGHGRGRGAARTAARAAHTDLPATPVHDQVPVVDAPAASVKAPAVPIVISGLQDALAQILSVCTGLAQTVSVTTAIAISQAGGGTQTPVARTPEKVMCGLQTLGAHPAQPVAAAQDFVAPVMPEDEQHRLERFSRLQPPIFSGIEGEDAQNIFYKC